MDIRLMKDPSGNLKVLCLSNSLLIIILSLFKAYISVYVQNLQGFGFIRFATKDAADKALKELHDSMVKNNSNQVYG